MVQGGRQGRHPLELSGRPHLTGIETAMYRIGIDVGGTFTDFTMVDEQSGAVHFHKVPSTPRDPSEAIQQGISDMLDMRSEEHTSELQSLMRISYAVFCLNKKKTIQN